MQGHDEVGSFDQLVREELKQLGIDCIEQPDVSKQNAEPYVTHVEHDVVGLALSGGGIRSATFNLGLLEGLRDLNLLCHFHYLSTVSGGGYIGGWLSALRSRETVQPGLLPRRSETGEEPREIRHLREFSNFLSPRLGFFEIETWQFVSSVVTAIVPALLTAVALIVLVVGLWLVVLAGLMSAPAAATVLINTVVTGLVLYLCEWGTSLAEDVKGSTYPWSSFHRYALPALGLGVIVGLLVAWTGKGWLPAPLYENKLAEDLCKSIRCSNTDTWVLVLPAAVWITTLATLIAARIGAARTATPSVSLERRAALDRVVGRLVALLVIWVGGLVLLNVVLLFHLRLLAIGGAVGGGGGASLLLRSVLAEAPTKGRTASLMSLLRVLTPQILAYLALIFAIVGIATGVLDCLTLGRLVGVLLFGCAVAILLLALFFFEPNEIGLHPFYRARIARAYLGASNFLAPANQQATQHPKDDLQLSQLAAGAPLHLVCCAANHLAGNQLGNLGRGARSAVLSRLGLAVGNRWCAPPAETVTLATALTASGAALNSNMGSYSMQLGSAVTFLLAACNIRLGYWVRLAKSGASSPARWPGLEFFAEMFGRTAAGDDSTAFHLSDGGHFENTGLYELLRRHCRYILVADCGADLDGAFDDLGNALRRAREDFGVEVEIDLTPLKQDANGFSPQHVAVGDILYPTGDRGVILLVKPTLVGDEPDDVLQYRTRNQAFPHESTGDQFYDEAQWESYRRLGVHAARSTFRFVEGEEVTVQEVFGRARFEWYPAPAALSENVLQRTARVYDIEKQVAVLDHQGLLSGVYPELPWPHGASRTEPSDARALMRVVPLLIQFMQLMEDVYISCQLETLWNHPLNMGWMNYLGRWATAPVMRTWWPILSPLYNSGFVSFVEARFGLCAMGSMSAKVGKPSTGDGVATLIWCDMGRQMPRDATRYSYDLRLPDGPVIEAAIAFVTLQPPTDPRHASWGGDKFFVPPSFWGAGIGSRFLHELLTTLKGQGVQVVEVTLTKSAHNDEASRKTHADLVQMYHQCGFETARQTLKATLLRRTF